MPYCLIPTTRPALVDTMIKSAEQDGWTVLTLEGSSGASNTRELLFEQAISLGAKYIRYADDDDICIYPHRETFCYYLDNNPNCDIVYGNFVKTFGSHTEYIKYAGDFKQDIKQGIGLAPWTWVAKASSLAKLNRIWDPLMAKGQGSWMIIQAALAGLKIEHLPVDVYHYHRYAVRPCITESNPSLTTEELHEWVDKI